MEWTICKLRRLTSKWMLLSYFFMAFWLLTQPSAVSANPTTNDLHGVAYGNGITVAVGDAGTIVTSTDRGTTWTNVTSANSSATQSLPLRGVIYGDAKFVAVGGDWSGTKNSPVIITSTDGLTWTAQIPATTYALWGVSYLNNLFVATGYHGAIQTSVDGVTWRHQYSDTTGSGCSSSAPGSCGDLPATTTLYKSAYGLANVAGALTSLRGGAGRYVVVGYDSGGSTVTLYSDNGTWWKTGTTSEYDGTTTSTLTTPVRGLSFGTMLSGSNTVSTFAGVGDSGLILTTPDAQTNWLLMNSANGNSSGDATPGFTTANLEDLVYANNMFVGVGDVDTGTGKAVVVESTDGANWYKMSTAIPAFPTVTQNLYAITYAAGKFIAVGAAGTVLTYDTSPSSSTTYKVKVVVIDNSTGAGTPLSGMVAGGNSVNCGCLHCSSPANYKTCSDTISYGTNITLTASSVDVSGAASTAIALHDAVFLGWSGDCSGHNTQCVLDGSSGNKTVTATFVDAASNGLPSNIRYGPALDNTSYCATCVALGYSGTDAGNSNVSALKTTNATGVNSYITLAAASDTSQTFSQVRSIAAPTASDLSGLGVTSNSNIPFGTMSYVLNPPTSGSLQSSNSVVMILPSGTLINKVIKKDYNGNYFDFTCGSTYSGSSYGNNGANTVLTTSTGCGSIDATNNKATLYLVSGGIGDNNRGSSTIADPVTFASVPSSNAIMTLSATSLTFGSIIAGSTSASQAITIGNTGGGYLSISSMGMSGGDKGMFSVSAGTCSSLSPTISPGTSCTVNVTFSPTSSGSKSTNLQIVSNAPYANSSTSVSLSGTGVAANTPVISVSPTSASFGAVAVGATSPASTFKLSNTGTAALTVSSIGMTGNAASMFNVAAGTCTSLTPSIAAGAGCTVTATFSPTSVGSKSTTLRITSNSNLTTTNTDISLTGTATASTTIKGDFYGRGRAAILWRNYSTGENSIWDTYGLYAPKTLSANLPTITDVNWKLVAVGNIGSGVETDIVWRHQTYGYNVVWHMTNAYATSAQSLPPVFDTNWQIAATGNFSGNGNTDILWRNTSTGENAVWQMNGITPTGLLLLPTVSDTNWVIGGTGDFKGDNTTSIIWRNTQYGYNACWFMNGATVTAAGSLPAVGDTDWEIAAVADFNGDGKPDILWRHKTYGYGVIWLMNGTSVTSAVSLPTVSDTNWKIVGPK